MEKELEKTGWKIINSWLGTLYPELRDTGSYKTMICYVNPDKLTGFYERRQKAVQDFLGNSGQAGAEKEYLLQMDSEVKKPYTLSSLFAGEWHNNTSSFVLTTRNGWKKIALVKVYTGLLFTTEFFAILMVGSVVSQSFFLGTVGWDMPIQTIKLIAIAPMNMLQAEIFRTNTFHIFGKYVWSPSFSFRVHWSG